MDEAHVEIEGYAACPTCPAIELRAVMRRTGGVCPECAALGLARKTRMVEVIHRGARAKLVGSKKRKGSRGSSRTKHEVDRAKTRAMRRLRAIFPEIYEILLAEERAAAGLEPWPLEKVQKMNIDTLVQTLDFADVYAALDEQGVGIDGDQSGTQADPEE